MSVSKLGQLWKKWRLYRISGRRRDAMLIFDELAPFHFSVLKGVLEGYTSKTPVPYEICLESALNRCFRWVMAWNMEDPFESGFLETLRQAVDVEVNRSKVIADSYQIRINPELYYGVSAALVDRASVELVAKLILDDLAAKWGDTQEIRAVRFLVKSNLGAETEGITLAACYAYLFSRECTEVLNCWARGIVRGAFYRAITGQQDEPVQETGGLKLAGKQREHIFPESQMIPLVVQWKHLTASGRHKEAMLVLEQIVVYATAMFEALAQYENYHYTVPLEVLVGAAQEKVILWLNAWNPKKGRLFTWFSKCAKNAFRSELAKVNHYRLHFHTTSDNLERFYGVEDHEVDKKNMAEEMENRIRQMTCRWGDPQEIGAVRYLTKCILDAEHSKEDSIRAAAYAYGIGFDLAKFFYNWAVVNLRHTFYDSVYLPFTEQDLLLASESYTLWPDFVDIVGMDLAKKCCAILGGNTLRIPSVSAIARLKRNYNLARDIDNSPKDPQSVADIARKHRKSPKTAQEIYERMLEQLDPKRYGEHYLYPEDES